MIIVENTERFEQQIQREFIKESIPVVWRCWCWVGCWHSPTETGMRWMTELWLLYWMEWCQQPSAAPAQHLQKKKKCAQRSNKTQGVWLALSQYGIIFPFSKITELGNPKQFLSIVFIFIIVHKSYNLELKVRTKLPWHRQIETNRNRFHKALANSHLL